VSNQMSNAPVTPAGSTPFFQTWVNALTKPSEQTYAAMATSPEASASKAYLWVFLTALISFFIGAVINAILISMNQQGGSQSNSSLIGLVCAVPIGAGLSVVGFMIGTGLVQWLAGLFKGAGTFNQLAYVFGAISAPVTLISSVLSVFNAIPFLGLCLWPVSILLFLYVVVLQVMAVKGVNRFGWGEAAGSVLIPFVVLVCILGVCVIGALMVMGPTIGNVFSSINQSLQGAP
jgi:Yip1-like protein